MLVEARTRWSERFLFRRRPNTISDSSKGLEVLVFPRISQFELIISLMGEFAGLWVVTQKHFCGLLRLVGCFRVSLLSRSSRLRLSVFSRAF